MLNVDPNFAAVAEIAGPNRQQKNGKRQRNPLLQKCPWLANDFTAPRNRNGKGGGVAAAESKFSTGHMGLNLVRKWRSTGHKVFFALDKNGMHFLVGLKDPIALAEIRSKTERWKEVGVSRHHGEFGSEFGGPLAINHGDLVCTHNPVVAAHGCECEHRGKMGAEFGADAVATTSKSGGTLKNDTWIVQPDKSIIHDYTQPDGKQHPTTDTPGDPKNDLHVRTTWTKNTDAKGTSYSYVMTSETAPGKWDKGATGTLPALLTPNTVIYGGPEGLKKHKLATNGGMLAGAVAGFFMGGPLGAIVGAGLGRYGGGKIAGEDDGEVWS